MRVIIIGAGAAGMAAGYACAVCARENGQKAEITILEKNEKAGKKIYITGKGRCNVTSACAPEDLMKGVVTGGKFLYSAFKAFSNEDVQEFFINNGCMLKTERGGRVFPVSDKSSDIISTFTKVLRNVGVEIIYNARVSDVIIENGAVSGVKFTCQGKASRMDCDALIVATGGLSYPSTGSTGDGYRFAEKAGHTIDECCPALVPFNIKETWVRELSGLSLRNIGFKVMKGDKKIYEDFGELLFTHFGISGPVVLSASSYICEERGETLKAVIDLKSALDERTLDERIIRDFEKQMNKDFINSLDELLPKSLIPVVVRLSGIDERCKVNAVTKEQRKKLLRTIKNLEMTIDSFRDYNEAIITHGGVNLKEISPKTMESKKCSRLYFAGEVVNVDCVTGGYNLQSAWSMGYLAGLSAVLAFREG